MKEEIENLIAQHKLLRQEVFEELSELSKINDSKISKEEKEALNTTIAIRDMEYHLRGSFISELEILIGV
jgi:predicted XRE-type DNA-binding protein